MSNKGPKQKLVRISIQTDGRTVGLIHEWIQETSHEWRETDRRGVKEVCMNGEGINCTYSYDDKM